MSTSDLLRLHRSRKPERAPARASRFSLRQLVAIRTRVDDEKQSPLRTVLLPRVQALDVVVTARISTDSTASTRRKFVPSVTSRPEPERGHLAAGTCAVPSHRPPQPSIQ